MIINRHPEKLYPLHSALDVDYYMYLAPLECYSAATKQGKKRLQVAGEKLGICKKELDTYDFVVKSIVLVSDKRIFSAKKLDCLIFGSEKRLFKSVILNDYMESVDRTTLRDIDNAVCNFFYKCFDHNAETNSGLPFYIHLISKLTTIKENNPCFI